MTSSGERRTSTTLSDALRPKKQTPQQEIAVTWLHNRLVRKLKWREARLKQAQIIAEAPITEGQ